MYYGNEDSAFIHAAPDEGRRIVNSVYYLWLSGVIYYDGTLSYDDLAIMGDEYDELKIHLLKHVRPIKRLLYNLEDFKHRQDTYSSPDEYLEMLLASVAAEINKQIQEENDILPLTGCN